MEEITEKNTADSAENKKISPKDISESRETAGPGAQEAAGKNKRRIYTLTGYPPEVVAVAFAKCSRSPEAFDEIAEDLNEDKSRKFHEKWIVGYGHSSVAEHAVLSIAIENVSIIATKVIEDCRLSSFTEKSTRYQVFDKTRYYKPKKLMDSELGKAYEEAADFLMDTYMEIQPGMEAFLRKKYPLEKDVPDKLYEMRIKNKVLDNCRYLLPASVMTNLGWTVNARQLEHGLVKFFSHNLEEMNDIASDIKAAAMEVTPTLVKYTDRSEYMVETAKDLKKEEMRFTKDISLENPDEAVTLVEYDSFADDKLVAALLYRFSDLPYSRIKAIVDEMDDRDKAEVIDRALKKLGKFDRPLRELEHVTYTFDILIDYGAFRDIQRHRMATQTNQMVTVKHGYSVPSEITEAGLDDRYRKAMEKAADAFYRIQEKFPDEAQYIVPLGYNKRVLFTWNLRDLMHFIRLRSGPTGHISYRRVAQDCYRKIKEVHPMIAKYIAVDMD